MRRIVLLAPVALLATACLHRTPRLPAPIPAVDGPMRTAFALRYIDIAPGTGTAARPKQCYYAHYTGWLTDGKKFDSSRDTAANGRPRVPISFPQSFRRVIAGWDLGFEGMRVGGKRRLFIPYQLGYGEAGRPPVIPPKAELIFDVELLAVADTVARTTPPSGPPAAPAPGCPSWQQVMPSSFRQFRLDTLRTDTELRTAYPVRWGSIAHRPSPIAQR